MRELGIDIETYSSADLAECGVYRYAESEDFDILLFGYCIDGGPVSCVDIASGGTIPKEVMIALTDSGVIKTAYNAVFERTCIGRWLGVHLDPSQWRCTMVAAARMGLPLSLQQCGDALGLEQGKMTEGKALIKLFCKPGKDGNRTMPIDRPEEWEIFKRYNVRDVETEQQILAKVRRLWQPSWEDDLYVADQRINDRGVRIDTDMAVKADDFNTRYVERLGEEAKAITGLDNPNSPTQLKQWLNSVCGVKVDSLNKKEMDGIKAGRSPRAMRVLNLRKEMGKTSNKKYSAMLNCVCKDGRVHGLLQYYGAARTGRWAGRLVQLQNLPQNHLSSLGNARRLVKAGDLDEFELEYGNVTQVLSELIRTTFIASEGRTFHVCDFSAIEARVIAWMAGEEWVIDVFRHGGDIYCTTASQMFGVPVEKHGRNADLRAKGKIAVLALGYGGGMAALEAMGGAKLGLTKDEERGIVSRWRDVNPHIVKMWHEVERAAISAITCGEEVRLHTGTNRLLTFSKRYGCLLVTLPSGRTLAYPRARYDTFEKSYGDEEMQTVEGIRYEGINQTTKKWGLVETYGGKLVENIVQATARDILGQVILRAQANGLEIVFHIHDEVIVDAKPGQTLEEVERLFSAPISWCADLPLKGAGYSTPYYLKD